MATSHKLETSHGCYLINVEYWKQKKIGGSMPPNFGVTLHINDANPYLFENLEKDTFFYIPLLFRERLEYPFAF